MNLFTDSRSVALFYDDKPTLSYNIESISLIFKYTTVIIS